MQKKTANELLIFLISLLTAYLEELSSSSALDENQFCYGEKTAYTECLEWLQEWEFAEASGLDFEIENRYPL
jgi:hypothetical protein